MENVQGLNWSYGVLHCGTWGGPCNEPEGLNNGGAPCQVTTCQAGFHVYSMEWDRSGPSDQLRWYIDGTLTHKVDQSQVPAATWSSLADHAGYFVILNVAIGGAFPNKLGGGPTAATKPGVPMVVDYVEVKYAGGQGGPTTPRRRPPPPRRPPPTATRRPPPPRRSRHRTPTPPPPPLRPPRLRRRPGRPSSGSPSNLKVTGTHAEHDHPRLVRQGRDQLRRAALRHQDRDRHAPTFTDIGSAAEHPVPVLGARQRRDHTGADRHRRPSTSHADRPTPTDHRPRRAAGRPPRRRCTSPAARRARSPSAGPARRAPAMTCCDPGSRSRR